MIIGKNNQPLCSKSERSMAGIPIFSVLLAMGIKELKSGIIMTYSPLSGGIYLFELKDTVPLLTTSGARYPIYATPGSCYSVAGVESGPKSGVYSIMTKVGVSYFYAGFPTKELLDEYEKSFVI